MMIPKPRIMMTKALNAGRILINGPAVGIRSSSWRALTNISPMVVSTAASPILKARIRIMPNPTRCIEIAAKRTTNAEGYGRMPPVIPKANKLRQVTGSPPAPGGKCE